MRSGRVRLVQCVFLLLCTSPVLADVSVKLPNPFYAMDTAFHRPGLTEAQQFDLVKQLRYDGVAWTEQAPQQIETNLAEIEKRGLKMYAIYYAATVIADGKLITSPDLPAVMEILKGHGTIIWLHIGGKFSSFDSLTENTPLIQKLRQLSDSAEANGLRIAVYPHLGEWTAHFGDAVKLAKVVNHRAFGVTFNLCHCLAVGDEKNIPALLDAAGPLLMTATINGADTGVSGGNWDKLIQPLGSGTFAVDDVLQQLRAIGFTGPVGFQGYGIKTDAKSLLEPTINAWQKMSADMPVSVPATKP